MTRVAIIGGGISGLSAAFTLEQKRRAGAALDYVLFERAPRLGGVMDTDRADGCLIEAGPDSFLTEKPWAIDLCKQVGLADQLIGSNDPDRKTYIIVKNKLIEIPDGLMFMVPTKIMPAILSPLFSLGTKIRMAREWFHPPHKADHDETVASMVERHYGPEMVDRLADPLLSGVYGGEASQLSVRAVLPRFAEMEAKHGSLGRAMLAARQKMAAIAKVPARPLFTSLKDGMQQMVDAVISRLNPESLRAGTHVQAIEAQAGGWTVSAGIDSDHFDAIILALPAPAAADLMRSTSSAITDELAAIRYSSSITVTLGYDQAVRRSLPPGFGFLVPRSEGTRMLAATFVHNKFPHRAPEDRALVRCFLGGSRDEQILTFSDDQILAIVRSELQKIIGLSAEPLFARVYKWRGAMAQYGVGHLERIDRIERLRQQIPGLAFAGNAFTGIGVPDCVRSGSEAVAKILPALGLAADPARIAAY
ncbi:MAG TPA: protoporphyrinogen oxidase [Terriglobales bacterium]|jgi:protoporphyrinogen/coproporphyrinogen III oxidase|nr:protoporphyrinogen oxidase [Terriglobales bacterium]